MTTTAMTLPDEQTLRAEMQAINKFQQIVHANLVPNLDYGVIPGTKKPTLLKPGAEKIAKLLGLADQYEIMDRQEDWNKPFFRYLIKCQLIHMVSGTVISEGLGECNSMESKYRYRWIGDRDLPADVDKTKLVSQERKGQSGGHWTVYRLDNEDIYSQVNTILKMSKKRALVDAALSAGRLSQLFTQDIEDMRDNGVVLNAEPENIPATKTEPVYKSKHWCKEHNKEFFMRGKMTSYGHAMGEGEPWCWERTADASQHVSEPVAAGSHSETPNVISIAQIQKIIKDAEAMGYKKEEVAAICKARWEVDKVSLLTKAQGDELHGIIERGEGLPTEEAE